MTPEELGKGPVDEEMKQRVHAIAQEAYRRRSEQTHPGHPIDAPTVVLAIEIALSGWTPPEPVDPDILAFREWAAENAPALGAAEAYRKGLSDDTHYARCFLAGARMATERERERAKVLLRGLESIVDADQDVIGDIAREALAKYEGGGE